MYIINNTKRFLLIGLGIFVASIIALGVFGLNLGIDFTGGALSEVSYDERPDKAELESALNALSFEDGLGGYSLRASVDEEGRDGYILRTRDLAEEERREIHDTLTTYGESGTIGRYTSIGPVIGEELRSKAAWAIALVALIVVLYVAWTFRGISRPVKSSRYGLITILALAHDVLVPAAFFAVLGYTISAEVDVLFVMAILAVLGYSVNDTIVVFDRVRENILANQEANKHEPFKETVGRSLSQTLMRSINTSVTTLLALLALFFFGGDVTQDFTLVLMVGIVAGTYSSLFIACPLLVWIEERQKAKKKAEPTETPAGGTQ